MNQPNNSPIENPIWLMSSAYDKLDTSALIASAKKVGAQGIDLCVFRRDGARADHTATHLDYENFGPEQASQTIDLFNQHELRLSIGAFENLIGGDPAERV